MLPEQGQILAEYASKYLKYLEDVQSASAYTIKSYAKDLQQFLGPLGAGKELYPPLNSQKVRKVFPSDSETMENLLRDLSRRALKSWAGLKVSSRQRKVACLKSFFRWLYEKGHTPNNLSSQLRSPRSGGRPLPHFLSLDEALALIRCLEQAAPDHQDGPKAAALILLLYGGGLRVSEACQLRWAQIHWEVKAVQVLGKGGRERLVALPDLVFFWLKKLSPQGEFIWGSAPLNPRVAYSWVRAWGERARLLKPLNPHALRHSYATHLLSSGMDLRVLQELLGHQSLVATQRYTHLSIDQLSRTMEEYHPLGEADNRVTAPLGPATTKGK